MTSEKIKFIKAEYFEEPTTISNVVEYLSSYINVRGVEHVEGSKTVLWFKFVSCDYNDFKNDIEQDWDAILIVGTEGAVQIHKLGNDGKLCLLFSCSIARIDAATIVPSPQEAANDLYSKDRPMMVAVSESRVIFHSMCSGRSVKEVTLKTELVDICASPKVVVASSRCQLVLLSVSRLAVLAILTNCRPSGYPRVPVAHCISDHWLAFADLSLSPTMASTGGDMSDPSEKPYVLSLLDIKKRMTPVIPSEDGDKEFQEETGVVSIISVDRVLDCIEKGASLTRNGHILSELMIAHFTAHRWTPVTRMVLDSGGTLLLTACEQGIFCHLFRVVPHPTSVSQAAVLHLYRLYRGETPRQIVALTISRDCRLAAAASDHGTVHIWPVSTYGGPLCVRTHCQGHVVNRLSRLERSAGMHEYQVTRPHTALTSTITTDGPPNHSLHLVCPRLPPLPSPCTLPSYTQLKPLSSLPVTSRPLPLVPVFVAGSSVNSPGSFCRTEWILVASPDARLLQYALNIHPDPQAHPQATRTELDGPFIMEKRSYLQWRIPFSVTDCLDQSILQTRLAISPSNTSFHTNFHRRDTQTALLQSVIPDLSESLEQLHDDNAATPQCWFSNIEISSQISFTSSIRRQEKFTMTTYQSKEPSEARLEVLGKSPSIASQLSNMSWRGDEKQKDESPSHPVGVPHSEQRIQICNSFCGSSISDSWPDNGGDSVIFALAHAIQDDDGMEETGSDQWDDPRTSYIESMTRDMSHVRLRRVSGSFSSDIVRLPQLSTSPTHADIPEERFPDMSNNQCKKQLKRQEKRKKKT